MYLVVGFMGMNISKKIKTRYWLPLLVLAVVLLGMRLYLPTWLKNHANEVLADIPGYHGSIQDVDVSLWRGAYVAENLQLFREGAETEVPFLTIPSADISVQWAALFNGKVVSEVVLYDPQVTYVMEDHQNNNQEKPETDDWTDALDELIPININRVAVTNGKLGLVELSTDPNIDLYIDDIDLEAKNLQLVKQTEKKLPSSFTATGTTIGQGQLEINATADLIRNIPDLDLNASVTQINLPALNPLTQHYAKVDVESGNLELYFETAIADGYLTGYFKPLIQDVKLIDQSDGFFKKLWEGVVNVIKFIFKNHSTDQLATKIPIEGDLNDVETSAWDTFVNILRNAFIKAFEGDVDDDITIEDAIDAKNDDS